MSCRTVVRGFLLVARRGDHDKCPEVGNPGPVPVCAKADEGERRVDRDAPDLGSEKEAMFRALDIDGDGFVSKAEAAGYDRVTLGFDRADRNRDGKLHFFRVRFDRQAAAGAQERGDGKRPAPAGGRSAGATKKGTSHWQQRAGVASAAPAPFPRCAACCAGARGGRLPLRHGGLRPVALGERQEHLRERAIEHFFARLVTTSLNRW